MPRFQGLLHEVSIAIMDRLRVNPGHQVESLHEKIAPKVARVVLSTLLLRTLVSLHLTFTVYVIVHSSALADPQRL